MVEIRTTKREQVFYEDVAVGEKIPPLTKKYNLMKMTAFSLVHGDFSPAHFDHKFAQENFHAPAPFAYGFQVTVYCSQLITDWISPNGVLKKFRSETRTPTYPYDTLEIGGKVTKKYLEGGEHYVDCEIWAEKQDGALAARGSATVTLPSRS